MTYLLVFPLQLAFNISKVFEIKFTQEDKTKELMINSVIINLIGLSSSFVSIDSLFKGDFWILIFYTSGSAIGKWIAMKYYKSKNTNTLKQITTKTKKKLNYDLLRFQH